MKFLVDSCAGKRLAEWLRSMNHDVLYPDELGADPGDAALLEQAEREARIVITVDQDFGALIYGKGQLHAGMIRLPDDGAAIRIELVEIVLERHTHDLEEKAIITVQGDRIRVAR